MVEDHERATGPWEIEWTTLPSVSLRVALNAEAEAVVDASLAQCRCKAEPRAKCGAPYVEIV
jgi:hypothetical protein